MTDATEHKKQVEMLAAEADAIIAGYEAAIAKAKTESVIDALTERKRAVIERFRTDLRAVDGVEEDEYEEVEEYQEE